MTDDLFPTQPPSLSPYEAFKERHGIIVNDRGRYLPEWVAQTRVPNGIRGGKRFWEFGKASTERDAVLDLAKKLQLAGWEEVSW